MDIDFHYYMTRTLAEKAGFSPVEAQDIAYANQYVDDACEVIPAHILDLPSVVVDPEIRLRPDVFNPVTTAHNDDTVPGGFLNAAQSRTYIPFHFIPDKPYGGSGDYDYKTRPDGEIANDLMKQAVSAVKAAKNNPELRTRALIKLGIASHSYIDTWAHQRFTGRFSATENTATDIMHFENGIWTSAPNASDMNAVANWVGTPIGHARVGIRPDMPHLHWRYKTPTGNVERTNPDIYLEAAKCAFMYFAEAAGKDLNAARREWEKLVPGVDQCIRYVPDGLDEKNHSTLKPEIYKKVFSEVAYGYNKKQWRDLVLEGDLAAFETANPINISEVEYRLAERQDERAYGLMPKLKYKVNHAVGMRWFYFHAEALAQRKYVISKIKPLPASGANDVVNMVDNLTHVISKNVPAELEKWLNNGAPSPVKAVWNTYRSIFPVPKHITQKHRYIQVTIENATLFDIIWTEILHLNSGKLWEDQKPYSIPALGTMTFGASNVDDGVLTGFSGAALFKISLGNGTYQPFTIAFSHPQESGIGSVLAGLNPFSAPGAGTPKRKCRAEFGDDTRAACERLDDSAESEWRIQMAVKCSDNSMTTISLHSLPGGANCHVRIKQG